LAFGSGQRLVLANSNLGFVQRPGSNSVAGSKTPRHKPASTQPSAPVNDKQHGGPFSSSLGEPQAHVELRGESALVAAKAALRSFAFEFQHRPGARFRRVAHEALVNFPLSDAAALDRDDSLSFDISATVLVCSRAAPSV
jgi:hypothetical protein